MPNMTPTNIDVGDSILKNAEFRDELLTFAGVATVLAGTILARDSVSGNMVPYVNGGSTNENGIPKELLRYPVTSTGAGEIETRVGVSGDYRKERLVINADGDDSNIDSVVIDELRNYSLIPLNVNELNIPDNQ